MKVLGYARVSTEEQASQGVSLDDQRERIAAYCTARGWELLDVITDAGWSGGDPERPGLRFVMDRITSKRLPRVGALVVVKLDRFTRRIADVVALRQLEAVGCDFVAIEQSFDTSTATGRAMLNMALLFAEWEREVIGERTKGALAHLKRNGKRYSNVAPYGYRYEGSELVRDGCEQEVLAYIREHAAAGVTGVTGLLNAGGFTARNGKPFAKSTVAKLLKGAAM